MTRGAFIVLEGLDRCGKTTQVELLVQRLEREGKRARLQKFPDRSTGIGRMINEYLQSKAEMDDRAIHLLFAANRWECAETIERDLAAGITVVADRYAFSGIAFSAAKGLPFDFCLNPDSGLPLPDVTLYLSLPQETASAREDFGQERYETSDMQVRVRKQFELVADEVLKRHGQGRWIGIDALGSIEEVSQRIWAQIPSELPELGRLWRAENQQEPASTAS